MKALFQSSFSHLHRQFAKQEKGPGLILKYALNQHFRPNIQELIPTTSFSEFSAAIQIRNFQTRKAYPQYSIYTGASALVLKPILPKFKSASNGAVSLGRKGSMLLEFSPANPNGGRNGYNWNEKINFALSIEEMGLLISQLPHYPVTLSRKVGDTVMSVNDDAYNLVSNTNEIVEKVFTAQPGDGATILFRVDYSKEGVGGQTPPPNSSEKSSSAPLDVLVQAGEWEIISSLLRDSIPSLSGWSTLVDVSLNNAMEFAEDEAY